MHDFDDLNLKISLILAYLLAILSSCSAVLSMKIVNKLEARDLTRHFRMRVQKL